MLILGGGALGVAALSYLGLQYMDDDKEESPELIFSKKELLNKKIKINSDDLVEKEVKEEIKNVKKEESQEETPKDSELYNSIEKSEGTSDEKLTGWGQFWKSTYNEKKNEVEASDFN